MRKRLRKKLRKGEFAVQVIPIAFRMRELPVSGQNSLLDRFITEAIEANGLQFGGGGDGDIWSGFAEPVDCPGAISANQRSAVDAWIASNPEIVEHFIGEITRDEDIAELQKHDPDFPQSRL
jgi:uncharacterized protein